MDIAVYVAIAILAIAILILIIRNVYIVQQSQAYVIERLGAFAAVWEVGLHFKVPSLSIILRKQHNIIFLHFYLNTDKTEGRPTYDRQVYFMLFYFDRIKYKI